jgi:hypothetical protein
VGSSNAAPAQSSAAGMKPLMNFDLRIFFVIL